MLYKDGMFDLVMCNGTLHHFADPAIVLGECWRVTASGGGVFFRDLLRPDDEAPWSRWWQPMPVRRRPISNRCFAIRSTPA